MSHASKALDVGNAVDCTSAMNKRNCSIDKSMETKKVKLTSTSEQLFESANAVIDMIEEAKDVVQNMKRLPAKLKKAA
jgi:hypothetical protein